MSKPKTLTPKQRKFALEWLKDCNGTQAAIRAGYSPRSARMQAARLLTKRNVQEVLSGKVERAEISADRVLEELRRLAFSNMADYMTVDASGVSGLDLSKLTREQAAAIQEIVEDTTGGSGDGERRLVLRTRFKLASKLQALELLGKYLKLFVDRVEVTGIEALADRLAKARKVVQIDIPPQLPPGEATS